mgnify:CR=1 FL=1
MPPLDRLVWRLVAAALGFVAMVVASLAVLLAAAVLLPALDFGGGNPDTVAATGFVLHLQRAAYLLPTLAQVVWPAWLVAILLSEIAAIRSLAVHLVVPPFLAAFALIAAAESPPAALVRLAIAAGLVAGFAHWLVAGRSAGVRPLTDARNAEGDTRPPHA